jgi:hypothetical protein
LEKEKRELRAASESIMERLKSEHDTLRMDNEYLTLRIRELEQESEKFESMEEVMMSQNKIQKQEMENLRKELKNANSAAIKAHIKSALLNWMDAMAKSKKEESGTMYNMLLNQLEFKPQERQDLLGLLDKLKLKKKTVT